MGNTCQNSRLEVINSFQEGIENTLLIHKADAPLPSYAVRASKAPKLSEHARRVIEEELGREPIADEDYKGFLLPLFYITRKGAYYDGEWKARMPHGRGKAFFDNGQYFEGWFNQGEAECKNGLLIFADGSYYRGEMHQSVFDGFGKFVSTSGLTYEGGWIKNKPEGKGREVFGDGNSYEGDFVGGVKEGTGVFKWSDGKIYRGQFRHGKMHGSGILTKGQTSSFQGHFEDNKKMGRGMLTTPYGVYEGQFEEGEFGGAGKFTWKDKRVYTGTFKNGLPEGKGTLTLPNGKTLEGVFLDSQFDIFAVSEQKQ